MESDSMIEKLKSLGLGNRKEYMVKAFSRNIGLLTEKEQEILSEARIAIPGMGGVGGRHLISLVRTGIGNFNIADFDVFEPANLNRQYGARIPDFNLPKLSVMAREARIINPYLDLKLFDQGIDRENVDRFLAGVDVVVDGLDFFQFDIRRLLFKKAAEKGIHVVTAAPLGFSCALLTFDPDGMGFDRYFNITDNMSQEDQYLSFAMGLAPSPTHIRYMDLKKVDLSAKAGPSLNLACQICAGMATTQVIKIILKREGIRPVPCYCQFDPYLNSFKRGRLLWGNKNPLQVIKKYIVKRLLKNSQVRKS